MGLLNLSRTCQEPGCSRINIVCDSYFDNSWKSHTREARGCGQFFPFTDTTNIPKDFQSNFLRHNRKMLP